MLKIIFTLVGAFVGAGFATGKEIFLFFTQYKQYGILSIFIFSLFLFILVYKCFKIKYSKNIKNYSEFLLFFENKYTFFNSKIFLFVVNIFLAASFYIMIIGMSSLFYYQFNFSNFFTLVISIFICYLIFYKKNINFIFGINSILMPILILFIILLSYFNINLNKTNINNNVNLFIAIFYSFLYLGYNSLLIIPIIFNLDINNIKYSFNISFWFSLIIFFITFLLNLLLLCFYDFIANIDLPVLYISNNSLNIFSFFYFFIVLSAIFTTMISSGYSFINNFNKKYFKVKIITFLFISFIFCFFSFSSLINSLYPFFGLVGFLQIFLILSYKS